MVLERLVPENFAEKKLWYAFFFGVVYSIIGIFVASILFPSDPSLVAVAFTAILLIPTIRKIYSIEERQIKDERKFSFKAIFKNHNDFVKFYLLIMLGIFIVYSISAIILPSFQINSLFREQLELRGAGAVDGNAISIGGLEFSQSLFWSLLSNNIIVLIACVIMAFLTGDGAIFLLTWNASLWGTIFGVTARNAGFFTNTHPAIFLGLILLIVLPHAFLEILGYIVGAISGGLMSNDIELELGESRKEQYQGKFWKTVIVILIIAIIIIIIGAVVETYVLENSTLYADIIRQSYSVV